MGFGLFFMIDMPDSEQFGTAAGYAQPFVTVFRAVIGSFEIGSYETTEAILAFCLFTLLCVIAVLNLLLAIMGDIYDRAQIGETTGFYMQRANVIVEAETMWPEGHWLIRRPMRFPLYIHVATTAFEEQ